MHVMWGNTNLKMKKKISQFEKHATEEQTVMENKNIPAAQSTSRRLGMVKERIKLFDGVSATNSEEMKLKRSASDEALFKKVCKENFNGEIGSKKNLTENMSTRMTSIDSTASVSFVHRGANKKRLKRTNGEYMHQRNKEKDKTSEKKKNDALPFRTFLYKTIKAPELPADPADISTEKPETKPPEVQNNILQRNLLKTKHYIRQLSKEELLENFYFIEQLRSSYIEQLAEVIKQEKEEPAPRKPSSESDEVFDSEPKHDIKIYRTEDDAQDAEFGIGLLPEEKEQEYVVEAYNKDGSELVISSLKVDHRSNYLPSEEAPSPTESYHGIQTYPENKPYTALDEDDFVFTGDFKLNRTETTAAENGDTYMALSECMSGLSLKNRKSYDYFGEIPMRTKVNEDPLDPSSKIQIGVEVFQDKTRRETLYDRDSNPRIEKVSVIPKKMCSNSIRSPSEKKEYIVEEIIATEAAYISHLEKIVTEYIPFLTKGNSTLERQLFSNIRSIYEHSQLFLIALKQCGYDHEKIAKTFIEFKPLLELYPIYSMNKSSSDRNLTEYKPLAMEKQAQLGDRLDLASYMLTPIQRLGKYILFLENISKELNKSGVHSAKVQTALNIVKEAMTRGNDFIAICSIRDCPLNLIKEAGSFVMREEFHILKPKKLVSIVFLFEAIVVFTVNNQKEKEKETFSYIGSIKMEDLTITTFDNEPFVFHLKNFPECKKGNGAQYTYILQAKTEKLKSLWEKAIEKRLWEQLNKYKEEASKNSRKQSTTSSPSERPKSSSFGKSEQIAGRKKKGRRRSTFYV